MRLQNLLNINKGYNYDSAKGLKGKDLQLLKEEALKIKKPSYLDMKIGTNCVLRSLTSKSYQNFREYDLTTTSVDHGYRVTGHCLYANNEVEDHVCEDYGRTRFPH